MSRILVTGGAGFIGSHLTEHLLEEGHEVVCLDDFNNFYDPSLKRINLEKSLDYKTFSLVKGDIRDSVIVDDLFKKHEIQQVVHLAARAGVRPSVEQPELYNTVNVNGTLNLLEVSRKSNVQKFVFGSSSSVYGINTKIPFSEDDSIRHQISPYGATKAAGELLCHVYRHLYAFPIICLRFFTVYGPRQRPDLAIRKFTGNILRDDEITVFGDGTTKRDYTYIDDILDGVLKALKFDQSPFEVFNLGESRTVELQYLISLIEKALGKKARIKRLPLQPGDVPVTYANIEKSKQLLGYNPTFAIEKGIERFVEWYLKEHGHDLS